MKKIFLKIISLSLSCYVAFLSLMHLSGTPQTYDDDNTINPFYIFDEKPESK